MFGFGAFCFLGFFLGYSEMQMAYLWGSVFLVIKDLVHVIR